MSDLNSVKGLKRLLITGSFKGKIDFAHFEKLEICSIKWDKKFLNFDQSSNLQFLNISRFKQDDLGILTKMKNLIELRLVYGYNASLNGIADLKNLFRLDIQMMLNLTNIHALKDVSSSFRELSMTGCKKVGDYSVFKDIKTLERINIADGPPIDSIDFIKDTNINKGFIGLKVIDKNFDALSGRDISYLKFREYGSK